MNGEGHVRFALVRPVETLEEVCTRLERYLKDLPPIKEFKEDEQTTGD